MRKINVLVVSKTEMDETFLRDIEAVDAAVVARDATALFLQELRRDGVKGAIPDRLEEEVQRDLARGADARTEGRDLDSLLSEAEVVFAWAMGPKNIMSRAPHLKWFHFAGVGLDRYDASSDIFDGRITVTNGRGALAIPIAEHIMGFTFMLAKDAPRLVQHKSDRRWRRFDTLELTGRTMGVVGMGAIGSNLTRMAKGIGMRVLATRRSATKREHNVGYVDEVYPREALLDMLGESDFVALALPLTGETRKLIGEKELRAMKPSAYIINISRGAIIDQQVLTRALKEGWIAGAGLDVFEQEPLAPENELWGMPNVILSPHMAGGSDRRNRHINRVFFDNLKRHISGQELMNVVRMDKGY